MAELALIPRASVSATIAVNPRDFHSLRYLGELHERKARESGDLAEFERAEAALRKALELFPNFPRD